MTCCTSPVVLRNQTDQIQPKSEPNPGGFNFCRAPNPNASTRIGVQTFRKHPIQIRYPQVSFDHPLRESLHPVLAVFNCFLAS